MNKNVTISGPCRLNLAGNGSYQIAGGANAVVQGKVSTKDAVVFTVDLDAIRDAYLLRGGDKPQRKADGEEIPLRKQRLIFTYAGDGGLTVISNEHTHQFAAGKFGTIVDISVEAVDAVELQAIIRKPECPMPPCPFQDHYTIVLRLSPGGCGC